MEMLRVITTENNSLVSFHRDQDLVPHLVDVLNNSSVFGGHQNVGGDGILKYGRDSLTALIFQALMWN